MSATTIGQSRPAARRRATLSPLERSERRLGFSCSCPPSCCWHGRVYPIFDCSRRASNSTSWRSPGWARPSSGSRIIARALGDERFWESTWNTVLYIVVTVPGALLVGLGLALLANLPFNIKWPVRLGLLMPWALPLVFAGLIFRWFFEYNHGVVNDVLVASRLRAAQWLSEPDLAFAAICLTIVWKTSSLHGADHAGRPADHPALALRGGGGRRGGRCSSSSRSRCRCSGPPSSWR